MLSRYIQVYEHQALRVDDRLCDTRSGEPVLFTEEDHKALERYHGSGTPYYSLIHRGVKFNEYVGVLQMAHLTIEVLPKADNGIDSKNIWQQFLITMLRTAGIFPETTGTASLKLRSDSILELYLQLFLQEVRYLVQTGLIRKYRKAEGNTTSLKGSIQFAQNTRHNSIHAERFYVRHTVYDHDNIFNTLLFKGLQLVETISLYPDTGSEAATLLLAFPHCSDVKIKETVFEKLHFDRKTAAYQKAINIARLLLLRLHPDVQRGSNDVLALMFNMNSLWEKYVFRVLRQELSALGLQAREQVKNDFWKQNNSTARTVRPDIVIYQNSAEGEQAILVLDTKWKCPSQNRIDDADLKQMLVYNLYNDCNKSVLLYPATALSRDSKGTFLYRESVCHAMFLPLVLDTQEGMRLDVDDFITNVRTGL
jgi:5-methylcytosine-specific restriction enzyme subunit McrC